MALKIEDLLREADQMIEKRASANVEVQPVYSDETAKLANLLMQEDDEYEKVATVVEPVKEELTVKIAHALVMVEMLTNLEKFNKIDEFEKRAAAQGFTQEQINEFVVEKML